MGGFNTQPPEGGWTVGNHDHIALAVSTHSRRIWQRRAGCFNTQPPEGGWGLSALFFDSFLCFNTQPPEGGWDGLFRWPLLNCCFNTQPPKGGWLIQFVYLIAETVSTHSRLKAAGEK